MTEHLLHNTLDFPYIMYICALVCVCVYVYTGTEPGNVSISTHFHSCFLCQRLLQFYSGLSSHFNDSTKSLPSYLPKVNIRLWTCK